MRTRTLAREATLQYLYEVDLVGAGEAEGLDVFLERQLGRSSARPFARELARDVLDRRDEIDAEIVATAENWTLNRMAAVDRNVLRIGTYEILFAEDIPPKVAINEAVDLARRFSTEEACAFVNGVLDSVMARHPGEQTSLNKDGQD